MISGISSPEEQTFLGIVFAFDVESLGAEQAFLRAWQLWMERLDPAELHGVALYDGAIPLPGLPLITVIAISGPSHAVAYVREAFAAPDLAAYPGVAPITHRFIEGHALPRERLVLRGYINDHQQFVPRQEDLPLGDIARHAGWDYTRPSTAPAPLPPRPAPPAPPTDAAVQETHAMRSAPTEGATQVMFRLWQSSFRASQPTVSRRRILGIIGAVVLVGCLGAVGLHFATQQVHAQTTPTPTVPHSNAAGAVLIVAPLATHLAIISNGGAVQVQISNCRTA